MKDFNLWQKLVMVVAVVVALSFAMAMVQVEPAGATTAPSGMLKPF